MNNFRRRQRLTPVLCEYAVSAVPDDVDLRAGIRQRIRQREREQQALLHQPVAPPVPPTLLTKLTRGLRSGKNGDESRSLALLPPRLGPEWQLALATWEWRGRRVLGIMSLY